MNDQQPYRLGDVVNGHVWDGQSWAPVNLPATKKTPWYRRPWALVTSGAVATVVVLGAIGANGPQSSDALAQPAGTTSTQTTEPSATLEPTPTEQPTESEEPSQAPEATTKPTVSGKDSIANKSEVKSARGNLDDLSEDVSDLRRDVRTGSVGWAAWNTMEIAFNVGQLEAVEAPKSISGAWKAEMKRLVSAHDDLSSAMENDSIKKTKSALGSLEKSIEELNQILDSW